MGCLPGQPTGNIGSESAYTILQLEQIEKSVVYAPFVDANQIVVSPKGQIP